MESLEPCSVLFEIGASELVVEVERDVGQKIKSVKKAFIQTRPVDRSDVLYWI